MGVAVIVSTAILTGAGVAPATATAWAGPLTAACQAQAITTPMRLAGFLSNTLHETGNLTALAESLNYSEAALLATFPAHFGPADAQRMGRTASHPADQQAIAERVYGGRYGNRAEGSGDGWLFRGHGAMQTTFRANYLALAEAIGWGQAVELLPAYLLTIAGACQSAAIFWNRAGCNAVMDAGNIVRARTICNGGTVGMADVQARYPVLLRLCGGPSSASIKVAPSPAPQDAADALDAEFNPPI